MSVVAVPMNVSPAVGVEPAARRSCSDQLTVLPPPWMLLVPFPEGCWLKRAEAAVEVHVLI